jgi:cytidylate kinase
MNHIFAGFFIITITMIIAIDGYSSCGKSTLAKQLAKTLGFVFVDTGAMYRAVTLYFLEHLLDIRKETDVVAALEQIHIHFENLNGENTTFLNGENVESKIRSINVSNFVSEVAALTPVRSKMVYLQRKMAGQKGLVMDGRDIGTVVFPDADVKFFITADPLIRAERRYRELMGKGQVITIEAIIENLKHRDHIDTHRADSPLRQAEDAILIDNSHLTIEQQFELALGIIRKQQSTL